MKINVKKTKAMVIGTKGTRVDVKIGREKVEQVTSFRYLGCIINENMKCEQEIKTRIVITKEAFRKKKHVFCESLSKELRKRLIKCFVWSIVLYEAKMDITEERSKKTRSLRNVGMAANGES